MKRVSMKRQVTLVAGIVFLFGWLLATQSSDAADGGQSSKDPKAPAVATMEFRGRLVCLAEEMRRLHGADLPRDHEHILGFRATDDRYYTLIRTQLSSALFDDRRLMDRELILHGRVYPSSSILDVTLIRSVHHGVAHDLYYWCDICAIKSVVPDECMCCRQPVVLVEEPLEDSKARNVPKPGGPIPSVPSPP